MFRTRNDSKNTSDTNIQSFDKEADFWQWYLWILKEARIVDTDYSVKGCYVWLDWGFEIYKKIYSLAQEAYLQSNHKQMQFPTLIKEETFLKETEFIRNFEDDVFWVDRTGHKKLRKGERLALRPTSELIIYPMFSKWIRSWRDLPLKVFQNVSIFRCETNETRPLIRNRETIGFIEGHSAFRDEKEALTNLELIGKVYREFFDKLGLPIKLVEVPNWDRFAGSGKTIDGYVLLPGSKSLELFTTAYLGTTFSEIFNIKYLDEEKSHQFAHLLCYGPSIDRIIASIIAIYGDNKGLILLPEYSPVDIVIVPIFTRKNKEKILQFSQNIKTKLVNDGFTVLLDDNEFTTPGTKYYQTERLGIPIRVEIGKKELSKNSITITRRDTLEKETLILEDKDIIDKIKEIQLQISQSLRSKALVNFRNRNIDLTNISLDNYLQSNMLENDIFYNIGWCGSFECAELIEQKSKFTIIGLDCHYNKNKVKCTICHQEGEVAILTKRY